MLFEIYLETMNTTMETPTREPRIQVHTSLLRGLVNEKNPEYAPSPNLEKPTGRFTMIETPADINTELKSTTFTSK